MAEAGYWPPLVAAAIGGAAVMAAQFIAQGMTARRERRSREHELEARRRIKAEDLQRQTLADLQDALGRLIESSSEVATMMTLMRKPAGKALADSIGTLDFIRVLSRYMESRARVIGLMGRPQDEGVRGAATEAVLAADALRHTQEDEQGTLSLIDAAQSKYLVACGKAAKIIRELDRLP